MNRITTLGQLKTELENTGLPDDTRILLATELHTYQPIRMHSEDINEDTLEDSCLGWWFDESDIGKKLLYIDI